MKRIVLGLVLIYFAADAAITYGGIWELRAHPKNRVTVTLPDGQTLVGELTRNWSARWVLRTNDGTAVEFENYAAMMFPRPTRPPPPLWRGWRAVLPLLLVLVGAWFWSSANLWNSRRSAHGGG